jgi:hypothetical protein
MQIRMAALLVATFSIFATGCSTTSGGAQYKASTQNVVAIQDHAGKSDNKVKLNDFTAAPGANDTMWCRANGPIAIGSGRTPAQFIHDALQEELFLAQAYSNNSPTVISGHLDELKFSSISPAGWEITITLSSSTGASYQTKARYNFDSSWNAINACKNVADAFAPAVQETLKKAIFDARFKSLIVSK